MNRCYRYGRGLIHITLHSKCLLHSTGNDIIKISSPVSAAIRDRTPMVALESTVLTHGMPWPINLKTALDLENIVRIQNSIPVTIGVLNNSIRAGFQTEELEELARSVNLPNKPLKLSRRDLYNVQNIKYGGTTVSGTIVIAKKLGIKVFATGGIGGVHQNSSNTMDISADLRELGRTSICVVSSGVKSFLDIPKTIEYLETEGVFVCTLGSNDFPGFFMRSSNVKSPHRVDTIEEAANMINYMERLDISSGMLLAVPIPDCLEEDGIIIQNAMEESVALAQIMNITGSEVSPFVLKNVCKLTKGKSLELNVKLIKNNAKIGGKLAFLLQKILKSPTKKTDSNSEKSTFAVIGGSIVDNNMKFIDGTIRTGKDILAQASYDCTSTHACGGVARNLSDVFFQLGQPCCFLSALGKDLYSDFLRNNAPHIDWSRVRLVSDKETSNCSVLLLSNNEIFFHIGNFEMGKQVTVNYVAEHLIPIKKTLKLFCLDCNVPVTTMEYVTTLAKSENIPVFVEPTDILLVEKLLELIVRTEHQSKPVDIVSPNISEFLYLLKLLKENKAKYNFQCSDVQRNYGSGFEFIKHIVRNSNLLEIIPFWIIKLGRGGVVFVSQEECFFLKQSMFLIKNRDIISPSGAGDCLAACALWLHFSEHLPWKESLAGGIRMAKESLVNSMTVPWPIDVRKYSKYAIQSWTKNMFDAKLLRYIV